MTTLKFSIMASRAELSQQTLVAVPPMSTVSIPRPRRWATMSDDPGRNALKRFFTICASSAFASSSAQSACPPCAGSMVV